MTGSVCTVPVGATPVSGQNVLSGPNSSSFRLSLDRLHIVLVGKEPFCFYYGNIRWRQDQI